MFLVLLKNTFHNVEQLLFTWIIYLFQFTFNLVKPVLDWVQLRWIWRHVKNVYAMLFSQVNSLLFVMDSTVIHNYPTLFWIILRLMFHQFLEKFSDKVQIFKFSVVALNEPPMGQAIIAYNCNQWEPFTFRNGTVYCDFFIGPWPSFISCHVKVEPRFVQKVDFCSSFENFFVLYTVLKPFFQWLACILLFGDTFYSFLSEFSHL